jgi:hypothetical protein
VCWASQESHGITPVRLQVPKVHARCRGDDGRNGSMRELVGEYGRIIGLQIREGHEENAQLVRM